MLRESSVITVADMNAYKAMTDITPEEGFVLSRIEGETTLGDLALICGMPLDNISGIITKFARAGVVECDGQPLVSPGPETPAPEDTSVSPAPDDIIEPPLQLTDEVSLAGGEEAEDDDAEAEDDLGEEATDARATHVRTVFAMLDSMTYYDLLRVDSTASKKDIRSAYQKLARDYHPDTLFRAASPDLRAQLNEIFTRINRAYATLKNNSEREEYDATISADSVGVNILPELPAEARPEKKEATTTGPHPARVRERVSEQVLEKRKEQSAPASPPRRRRKKAKPLPRKQRANPFTERVQKARRIFEGAVMEMDRGNFAAARTNLKLAISIDAHCQEYKDALEEIDTRERMESARKAHREGQKHEREKNYSAALINYREAITIDETNSTYFVSLAKALMEHEKDFNQARIALTKAIELKPNVAEFHALLGDAYMELQNKAQALKHYERAAQLEPPDRKLAKTIKKLQKSLS